MSMRRRQFLKTAAAGTATIPLWRGRAWARPSRSASAVLWPPDPTRWGSGVTPAPNSAVGGPGQRQGRLAVKGEGRRPIEYVTIDDRSEIETAVRFYEKLMGDDKVDLILPPWGTAMNFAVAPIANKYGYPMIGPTVISNKLKELSLPYFYAMLAAAGAAACGRVRDGSQGPRDAGRASKVGVAYVNDLFGIELDSRLRPHAQGTGLEVVDTKSYPLGAEDSLPILKGFKDAGMGCVRGTHLPRGACPRHHPGQGGEPAVFFTGVGTALPFLWRSLQGRRRRA